MSQSEFLMVTSPPEAVALRHPALAGGEVMPVRWTAELLLKLDWTKIVELVRSLLVVGGFELGGTRIWPDAMAEFRATLGQGMPAEKIVMRLAGWNRWIANFRCVEIFAADLAAKQEGRGVYLAPGGISPSARVEAARRGIDMMDADELAATLNVLPPRPSKMFYEKTMSGQPFVPSCPACLRPLTHSDETPENRTPVPGLPDLTYHRNDTVADRVEARRIEILRNCEVHFLREVRAQDVFVQGVAVGDFLCEGSIVLTAGAVLCGDVAARSVDVRPGAELRGETRILPGNFPLAALSHESRTWACGNLPHAEGCKEVRLLPHWW